MRVGRRGGRWIRFNVSGTVRDPIAHEFDRLGVRLNVPADTIRRRGQAVPLTSEQEVALQQTKGRAVRTILERVMRAPGYRRLDDERGSRPHSRR